MNLRLIYTLLVLALVSWGCKNNDDTNPAPTNPSPSEAQKRAAITQYADQVYANCQDALSKAQTLNTVLQELVANPSAATLANAQTAWLNSRPAYLQLEATRFTNGPLDEWDPLLNSWPLDEAYLDYVVGAPNSGIINATSTFPIVNDSLLTALNQQTGEANVTTGYHAIEFLLWGQDLSTTSNGARTFGDYVTTGGTSLNPVRRGQYLLSAGNLLVQHLQALTNAWAPGNTSNYRAQFLAKPTTDALKEMLEGAAKLTFGELRGERISVAYDTQEQEDEHSCFSDNTHIDHEFDARGIQNVLLGRYIRTDSSVLQGEGIISLVRVSDANLADQLTAAAQASIDAIVAMPEPFDQAIVNPAHRPSVLNAIQKLEAQATLMQQAAQKLGFSITTSID